MRANEITVKKKKKNLFFQGAGRRKSRELLTELLHNTTRGSRTSKITQMQSKE